MKILAVYDIHHPRRLVKVAKIMVDYGIRVQKSKFELDITHKTYEILRHRIDKVINHAEDKVKYIPLCERCRHKIEIIGQGHYTDPDEEYYII